MLSERMDIAIHFLKLRPGIMGVQYSDRQEHWPKE